MITDWVKKNTTVYDACEWNWRRAPLLSARVLPVKQACVNYDSKCSKLVTKRRRWRLQLRVNLTRSWDGNRSSNARSDDGFFIRRYSEFVLSMTGDACLYKLLLHLYSYNGSACYHLLNWLATNRRNLNIHLYISRWITPSPTHIEPTRHNTRVKHSLMVFKRRRTYTCNHWHGSEVRKTCSSSKHINPFIKKN